MKTCTKLLFILLLFLLVNTIITNAQSVTHQYKKSELSFGYGRSSIIQLIEGVHAGEYGYNEYQINTKLGPLSATYRYYLFPKLSIGLTFVYEKENGDWNIQSAMSSNNSPITIGTFKRQVFTFAPEVQYVYSKGMGQSVYFYGYFGWGKSYLNGVNTYSNGYYISHFFNGTNNLGNNTQVQDDSREDAFQFCPIGMSVGRKIRGVAELGFGYKGILNLGLILKF